MTTPSVPATEATVTPADTGTTEPAIRRARPRRPLAPIWIALGGGGWVALGLLVSRMYTGDVKSAGFDLELILQAGRDLAAGRTPYDPEMLSGIPPAAPTLFFSYPPHVAQLTSLVAGVPMPVMLGVLWLASAAGVAAIAAILRNRLRPDVPVHRVVLPALAAAPFCLALATGLLFGNVNALFPLLYGLVLVAAISASARDGVTGGAALALASVTKLHPGSLGLWFLVRGIRERRRGERPSAWLVVAAAIAVAVGVLAVSLLAGGLPRWEEYLTVVRTGAQASIIDPRNAGPAPVIASLLGQGEATARLLQIPVTLTALAITVWAAWTRDDPLEGVAWAAAASLATLPVTWYHYPAAFIPFAIAAALRAYGTPHWRTTIALVLAGLVVSGAAIAWLPLEWAGIALVILAIRRTVPVTVGRSVPASAAA